MERNRTFERRHVLGARWGRAVELESSVSRMVYPLPLPIYFMVGDILYIHMCRYVHVVELDVESRVDAWATSHHDFSVTPLNIL